MNILIIYAHPSKFSFTYSVLLELKRSLLINEHKVVISDLYKNEFSSDLSELEYNREGLGLTNLPLAQDVISEQTKLEKADVVIFLYPVWWSDCPAKLKGWFDRVYSTGFAYSKTVVPRIMQKIQKGLVICTAGHPNNILEESGIDESMRRIMLNDRLGDRFEVKEMIILGGTLNGTETKIKLLNRAFQIGLNI